MISPLPVSISPVRLLVLQGTPFCNIDCKYCYLPDRTSPVRMSPATADAIVSNLIASDLVKGDLLINWHAGEPLVLGPAFYEDMVPRFNALNDVGVSVRHSLQTNAMLITPQYCDVFQSLDIAVGVSIDGPAFLHDKFRRTRNDRPTHAAAMKGVGHLKSRSIPFNVICVVTDASLDHADDMYEFFLANEMTAVALNIDELEGANTRSSMTANGYGDRFMRFMDRLYSRCERDGVILLREFSEMEDAISNPRPRKNSHTIPFVNLTIGWNGDFSTFSPELLGHTHLRYGSFAFGNVHDGLIRDVVDHPHFRRAYQDILRGVERCEANCDYFDVCKGGCPSNKLFENDSFDSTETLHCRNKVWSIAELVMGKLEAGQRHAHLAG
ncbi:cyclophane-forming radical SAM/SPASM peptide maturase GrrM/OscB [Variovorax sp. J22R133]|uniref:cyclophane-forming radical SAM/SPASM peptide maturase GrrM/OscB n=1 Tax=Variovorax brevis TaxID=3053503 RepID=UPI0025760920|nr:cyclophane-forming radical SAM/SPASM peptide maturase GrrM/OscB [Variovorax sp. J22R133]MDM0112635.1 cyclophane-forming radical SAM/SPASM peptide maturase GrrM/OscB [Variovorax sp. J22R133]